ncbi:hypothetical protein D3C71_1016930 [compost metagenome]
MIGRAVLLLMLVTLSAASALAASPRVPALLVDNPIVAEQANWLEQRDELKRLLRLQPSQLASWAAFEVETAQPMLRTITILTSDPPPESDSLGFMDYLVRGQEALYEDIGDWLQSLRTLDEILDVEQRTRLDEFLLEADSPFG